MADKLIFIPNDDAQNFPLLYLDYNQWLKYLKYYQPIKIQLKFPNLLSQRMRKHYNKTIGTSVINSPMSPPPSLQFHISRTELFTTAFIYSRMLIAQSTTKAERTRPLIWGLTSCSRCSPRRPATSTQTCTRRRITAPIWRTINTRAIYRQQLLQVKTLLLCFDYDRFIIGRGDTEIR